MPTISRFYGILIQMYFADHPPPHFHALYAEFEALIAIGTFEVIRGELPPRALALVLEWAGEPERIDNGLGTMRAESNAGENSPTALAAETARASPWRVVDVKALPGFRLEVAFADGLAGIVDMSAMVHSPNAGVFAALADLSLFARVTLQYGAVTWPGDLDLAPDAMHAAIQKHPVWSP